MGSLVVFNDPALEPLYPLPRLSGPDEAQPSDNFSFVIPGRAAWRGPGIHNPKISLKSPSHDNVCHTKIERAALFAGKEIDVVGHRGHSGLWIPGSRQARPGMTSESMHVRFQRQTPAA